MIAFFHWLPLLAGGVVVATTILIYVLFAIGSPPPVELHLSNLLNNLCPLQAPLSFSTSFAIFGYGVAMTLFFLLWLMIFARERRDAKAFARALRAKKERRAWIRLPLGLASSLAFQFMLGFPSGWGSALDNLHRVSAGIGVGLFLFYAISHFDLARFPDWLAVWRDVSVALMVASAFAMLGLFFAALGGAATWNQFAASQLAFGLALVSFVLSLAWRRAPPAKKAT